LALSKRRLKHPERYSTALLHDRGADGTNGPGMEKTPR
jgi:hypothetical protein